MIPGSGRSPGEENGYPVIFLPKKFHGQRGLVGLGCSPWGHKESESTERLSRSHLPQVCMPAVIFSPLIVLFFFFGILCWRCLSGCKHYSKGSQILGLFKFKFLIRVDIWPGWRRLMLLDKQRPRSVVGWGGVGWGSRVSWEYLWWPCPIWPVFPCAEFWVE